jgi:hypothetical protein
VLGRTRWRSPLLPPRGDSARVLPPPETQAAGHVIELVRAGFRLRELPGWSVDDPGGTWARIVTPEASIDVRVETMAGPESLEERMQRQLALERRLAETIKLLSPHLFLEEAGWRTAEGVEGRRALFGLAGAPRRLLYYLRNPAGELVRIDVGFRAFDTGGYWDRYDRVLRHGLERLPPVSAAKPER